MKKWIFALIICLTFTSNILAQVKANSNQTVYNNGDSYGYYIDPVPGAVSYVWSTLGGSAMVWDTWDEKAVDITFSDAGMTDVICTVTLSNGTVVEYGLSVDVYEED